MAPKKASGNLKKFEEEAKSEEGRRITIQIKTAAAVEVKSPERKKPRKAYTLKRNASDEDKEELLQKLADPESKEYTVDDASDEEILNSPNAKKMQENDLEADAAKELEREIAKAKEATAEVTKKKEPGWEMGSDVEEDDGFETSSVQEEQTQAFIAEEDFAAGARASQ